MNNANIDREAQEIAKAAEHVNSPESMHAVQTEVAAERQRMSPTEYKRMIDEAVAINDKARSTNPHLPQIFQIHQPGNANNDNIGFCFDNSGAPTPDAAVAKEMTKISKIFAKPGAASDHQLMAELEKAQKSMTLGEFRELYTEAYAAEKAKGGTNPLKPVGSDWRFKPAS